MKKTLFQLAGIAVAVAGLSGCTSVATFDYSAAPGPMMKLQEKGIAKKTIAVLPFMDQRGVKYADPRQSERAEDRPAGDHGSFYTGFLPLVIAGVVEKEEPENSEDFVSLGRFHFSPQQDLAEAAELSLKSSNLFASVSKANTLAQAQTDYLWRGKVTNTYYRGGLFSYCITYFLSPALWLLGAPNGKSENELGVRFELVERVSGNVLWSYEYNGKDYILHWLYARVGKDVSLYPQLMKQAMNSALYDLSQKMPELSR